MKIRTTVFLTVLSGNIAHSAVVFSAQIDIFDSNLVGSLDAIIEVSDTPIVSIVGSTTTTQFQITSVSFSDGMQEQSFANLTEPSYVITIAEPFPDSFNFQIVLPLPIGTLGTTESLFLVSGFEPGFDQEMLARLDTVEVEDIPVFFGDSLTAEPQILGGGSEIAPVTALPDFNQGMLDDSDIIGFGDIRNLSIIPEPSVILLMVLASVGVAGFRRRPVTEAPTR